MSKAIGRTLGAGANAPSIYGTENNIMNYLNQFNQPQIDNNLLLQALQNQMLQQQSAGVNPWQQQYNALLLQTLQNQIQLKQQPVDYSLYGTDFSKEFIDQMLGDNDYQRALQEYAIPNEKGYVNNINDPGGETNMGISKRYHPNEDIKNLTRERANALLYNEVWNWNGINKLPREIRGFVFDHGIRTSPQNAIETTHRALGINPVGDIIGDTTLNLLQNTNYEDFLQKYQNLVREQDKNNANYNYFGNGWNNRTNGYHVSY